MDKEMLSEMNEDMLFLDGFDDCLMGTVQRGCCLPVAVYDTEKVIEKLAQEMSYDEALEFFDYNIIGFCSEYSPAFFYKG